jgi:hypothetical protein
MSSIFARSAVSSAAALGLLLSVGMSGCGKKETPAPAPAADKAEEGKGAAPAAALPATASAVDAPAAASPAQAEADPLKNGWNLPPKATAAKDGGRVFVLTRGKDRSYTDTNAPYQLFAHDMGGAEGEIATIKELGGGTFRTTGLFIIPAGSEAGAVKVGDMVLAEWASSLKHALVTKVEADKITVRYTDLPASWKEEQLTRTVTAREVTVQKDGLQPGNFAVAKEDGRKVLVLLISQSGDQWLARKFSNRVAVYDKAALTALPLKPSLKAGQFIAAPWVGMMYKCKVKAVKPTHVESVCDGTASKDPVVSAMGMVAPWTEADEADYKPVAIPAAPSAVKPAAPAAKPAAPAAAPKGK